MAGDADILVASSKKNKVSPRGGENVAQIFITNFTPRLPRCDDDAYPDGIPETKIKVKASFHDPSPPRPDAR